MKMKMKKFTGKHSGKIKLKTPENGKPND